MNFGKFQDSHPIESFENVEGTTFYFNHPRGFSIFFDVNRKYNSIPH